MDFSFIWGQEKQHNNLTNRNLNFHVLSCENLAPHQCLCQRHNSTGCINISHLWGGVDTMLHTGEKVRRGSHDLGPMCWDPQIHLPSPLTHSLPSSNKLCIRLQDSWMGVEIIKPSRASLSLSLSARTQPQFQFQSSLMKTNCECEQLFKTMTCVKPARFLLGIWFGKRSDQKNSKHGLPTVDTRPTFSWTLVQLGGGLKEQRL